MSRKPCVDADARERVRNDLATCLAVEAAAGAGKTTELVTRLLNIIRSGRARLSRIVTVTFTEKAAGELKMRIREEIEKELAEAAKGREESHAEAAGNRQSAIGNLRRAIEDLGHAPIGTIHSFCAGLLRERPVEAGVDPRFTVLDESARMLLEERVWSQWVEEELARPDSPLIRALAHRLNLEGDRNTNSIYQLARKMLGCRELVKGRPKAPADCPNVRNFVKDMLPRLHDLMCKVHAHTTGDVAGRYATELEEARRALALSQLMRLEGQAEAAVVGMSLRQKPLAATHWKDKARAQEAAQQHLALRADLDSFKAKTKQAVVVGVADALVGCLEALRKAKDEEGVLDFDDLLLLTRNMLRVNWAARDHFKASYDFILVDEFQDTDPLQVEIVFFLAERGDRHAATWEEVELEPGKLFFVGDPKQSIYRFRRADIETYEKAKRQVTRQGAELTLSQSFRPVPGIAEAVNAIFEPLIRPPDEGGLYQPTYVPLNAYRDTVSERPAALLLYPPPGHEEDLGKMDSARRLEAQYVAAMSRRIVEDERWLVEEKPKERKDGKRVFRPARYGDIAILAERFSYSDEYADALADAGVPLRIIGGRHFYRSHEVHSLLAVLKAIDDPHDRLALVGALRGLFFGVSDEALVLAKDALGTLSYQAPPPAQPLPPEAERAMKVLREFHQRRNAEPTSLLLQRLYDTTKVLELSLLRPRGEQRVANLLKAVEQARALEATQRVSFRSFVRWLDRLREAEPRETESPSGEAGDNYVQFLSIHGAKGLEFPIVFVVDMTRCEKMAERFIVFRDRPPEAGQFAFYLAEKGQCFTTPNWDENYDAVRERAEDARLFYVAATRARDYLILLPGWGRGDAGLDCFLGDDARAAPPEWGARKPQGFVYDTRTLALSERPARPLRLRVPEALAAEGGAAAWPQAAQELLAARQQWRVAIGATLADAGKGFLTMSPSRLGRGFQPTPTEGDEEPGDDTGRKLGSLVHHCLRRAGIDDAAALEAMLASEARRLALPDAALVCARRLLQAALASPLLQRARAADAAYHEVPFALDVGGAVLTGTIDLLFVEGGRVTIVDWKTDGVASEAEIAERAAVYRPQALAYALAVRTLLCTEPQEVVLFFLTAGREWQFPVNQAALEEAARTVAAQEP